MLGETSGLTLRVNQLAVNDDIKHTAAPFDQLSNHPRLCLDRVRQTGGLRGVVSLYAVRDRNLHGSMSPSGNFKSREERG